MPQNKYEPIYREIRNDILSGKIACGDLIPSENEYAQKFGVTRNTVRRAISILTSEGLVLPQHGRGVQVIWEPANDHSIFTVGGIESFSEVAKRSHKKIQTSVITFKEITADRKISEKTGFDEGTELYYIERVRMIDNKAIVFDTNMFLKSETEGLTPQIAEKSIYHFLEHDLGMTITTSRRRVMAELATKKDEELLSLGHLNFVLSVTGQVFNSKGIMFEYTQSRHVPDRVCFVVSAIRQNI